MKIDFDKKIREWLTAIVPMQVPGGDVPSSISHLYSSAEEELENYLAEILEAKYENATLDEVATAQKHLTNSQYNHLKTLISKIPDLFSRQLRCHPHSKVHVAPL